MDRATIINAVLFQATWFACVLGGAYGWFWPGVLGVLALILSLSHSPALRHDALIAMVLMPVGAVLDTIWIKVGILDFNGAAVAPAWIILMWLAVALTVNHSLAFFRDRPLFGALAVLGAAPLSYLAGARLGAVVIPEPALLAVIALTWAVLFYAVFRFACYKLPAWSEATAS
ncbi:MAG: DUF2878 domain-containing protein [Pseudomonadales bacterium]